MSTQSFMPNRGRGLARFTSAVMLGALLALQGLLPSTAFARSQSQSVAFSSRLTQTQDYVRDEAGVSVVRLVASYGTRTANTQVVCTGIGVLIASAPSSGTEAFAHRNWVLADASLLNSNMSTCGKAQASGGMPLGTVRILASDEYTNKNSQLSPLSQLNCGVQGSVVSCKDDTAQADAETYSVSNGEYTLFSFLSSVWQPSLTLNFQTNVSLAALIGLADPSGQIFPQSRITSSSPSPLDYLAPAALSPTISGGIGTPDAPLTEGGTPFVDANGNLVKMHLSSGVALDMASVKETLQTLNVPFSSTDAPNKSNPLATNWDQGIRAYYNQQYQQSDIALKKIPALNANFVAAQTFDKQAVLHLHGDNSTQLKSPTPSLNTGLSLPMLILIAVGVIVLIGVLLLLAYLVMRARRRRVELQRFAAEQAEARRIAEAEVQHQRAQQMQPATFGCPNCHQPVHLTDSMCPYCRFPLSPSASGLNIQLAGTMPMPPAPVVVNPPVSAAANPLAPPTPISEQPTQQFPPNQAAVNGGVPVAEAEHTVRRKNPESSYSVQQASGHNLSLAVGTLSDPGIRRKHKPNEDSLFAMQGSRTHNSQPQQFGLFVVADGMGGHANGQDASRLAIQTMIDYTLPKISSSEQLDDEGFQKLLGSGVQHANQAVHAHNVEVHADMGTTMTAALVVGSIAYVANVGDSRTYLYREGQGLQKVTNDHSVVASLVLAGIIQPDDIYTHPKRNQIYRSLGEKPSVEVDIFRVNLQPKDKLLLCSDGLWDMVRDPLIQEVLGRPTGDPNRTGKDLIKAALDGGGEDNVTVIVAQFGEMNDETTLTGVQLLAKPETVTIPNLPLQQ